MRKSLASTVFFGVAVCLLLGVAIGETNKAPKFDKYSLTKDEKFALFKLLDENLNQESDKIVKELMVKYDFKDYAALTNEIADLSTSVRTDYDEIELALVHLAEKFSDDEWKKIYDDLAYHFHDKENVDYFDSKSGIIVLCNNMNGNTAKPFVYNAFYAFAVAMKSSSAARERAVDQRCLRPFLNILSHVKKNVMSNPDTDFGVFNEQFADVLTAYRHLLHDNPKGQELWVQTTCARELTSLITLSEKLIEEDTRRFPLFLSNALRITSLFGDALEKRVHAKEAADAGDKEMKEKVEKYKNLDMTVVVKSFKWCDHLYNIWKHFPLEYCSTQERGAYNLCKHFIRNVVIFQTPCPMKYDFKESFDKLIQMQKMYKKMREEFADNVAVRDEYELTNQLWTEMREEL